MRLRFPFLCLFALAALLFVAGCERSADSPFTAEVDDSDYRRGKELLRQGRNQEALVAFQKVVENRGDDAPESHLELGILYQQHIKDPITAIYHYRKFRELKPNSPQADLVRQRIDAATREFARTLPAQPLDNQMERLDLLDKLDQLQRENAQLKDQLIAAKTQAVNSPRPAVSLISPDTSAPLAVNPDFSPIAPAPDPTPVPQPVPQSSTPAVSLNRPVSPSAVTSGRKHTVVKGDTLFSLAQRYYNNKSRWRDIYAANRDVMKSQNDLKIGMELKIPQ
ncbi:MAG TPA: LysM peptidoglycan-binding domain-containing protein [Rariglobus sp.]|jgi:tetratricopeptide (TPR) repeat protein|nr:LysM peptidoglycan-binding domain-containing protein [Rariglobus sp.]